MSGLMMRAVRRNASPTTASSAASSKVSSRTSFLCRLAMMVRPSTVITEARFSANCFAGSLMKVSSTACIAACALPPAPGNKPSDASSWAKAVRRTAGLAPRCGRVCEGRETNFDHTVSGTSGFGFIFTGLMRMRPAGGVSPLPSRSDATTRSTASRSK